MFRHPNPTSIATGRYVAREPSSRYITDRERFLSKYGDDILYIISLINGHGAQFNRAPKLGTKNRRDFRLRKFDPENIDHVNQIADFILKYS